MKQLLGDNQFFGVNHHDLVKGDETKEKFNTNESIISFINEALNIGLDGFMINSNKRGYEVINAFHDIEGKEIHYSVPYPHKFASIVNENGLFDLLKYVIVNSSFHSLFLKLPSFVVTRNVKHLLPLILDLETPSRLKKGSYIYLQNVVTDLLLGMKRHDLLEIFCKVILDKGYRPGIITLNPVILDSVIKEFPHKIQENLIVCYNINDKGFNVFPDKLSIEALTYQSTKYKKMGMSILSSGGISSFENSLSYIKKLPLDYVVYGSSNLKNIAKNYSLLR